MHNFHSSSKDFIRLHQFNGISGAGCSGRVAAIADEIVHLKNICTKAVGRDFIDVHGLFSQDFTVSLYFHGSHGLAGWLLASGLEEEDVAGDDEEWIGRTSNTFELGGIRWIRPTLFSVNGSVMS